MTSYTKQLRTSKGVIAALSRENLDPATAVLAEPVAREIEQDVLAPAEQIEQGTDALMEAEADAGLLENTAQILEDASGETAADVDVATPELANITVERISAKYGMARTAVLSKESLGAAAGRVETARFISKEAFEKAGELRKRVSEGLKKLIEWFKNLIKNVFDKRIKLEKRFQAIVASAKAKAKDGYVVKDGSKHRYSWQMDVNKTDVIAMIGGFKKITELAKENTASLAGQADFMHDFNPTKICNVVLTAELKQGKLSVTKQSSDERDNEPNTVPELSEIEKTGDDCLSILKNLKNAEADCNKIISEMGTTLQNLKAVVTGEDNGAGAERSSIIARYQGVSTLSGALSSIILRFLSEASTGCEQSLAAYEAPAAA